MVGFCRVTTTTTNHHHHMTLEGRVHGGCLVSIWWVHGVCLEHGGIWIYMVVHGGEYMVSTWWVFGTWGYLDIHGGTWWWVHGEYMVGVWRPNLGKCQGLAGKIRRLLGKIITILIINHHLQNYNHHHHLAWGRLGQSGTFRCVLTPRFEHAALNSMLFSGRKIFGTYNQRYFYCKSSLLYLFIISINTRHHFL